MRLTVDGQRHFDDLAGTPIFTAPEFDEFFPLVGLDRAPKWAEVRVLYGASSETYYLGVPYSTDVPLSVTPEPGTPLAVHLANRRRGSFPRGLGLGAVVAGAGILGTLVTIRDETAALFLVLTPLAQVAVAVHNERSTSN